MRRVPVWLSWFAGLFVLWLVLVGTVQGEVELIAGLCAAAIGTTAVEVVRSQGLLGFRVEWRWLRQVWKPLARVLPEFLLLMGALVRRPRGSFRTIEIPVGGERAVDAGRRRVRRRGRVVVPEQARRRRRPGDRRRGRPRPRPRTGIGRAPVNVWLWGATALLNSAG
jgi:hypothetical protein